MTEDLKEDLNRVWLERLYKNSPGYLGITKKKGNALVTKWLPTSQWEQATKYIGSANDTWISVGTYAEDLGPGRKGRANQVISIPGFWFDLDYGTVGHHEGDMPNPVDEEAALAIIKSLPEPSLLLNSGGGLQGFYLFNEPWIFEQGDKAPAQASEQFSNHLKGLGAELGVHVDAVANLDRIMRAPGSVNHKEGLSRSVAIRWADKPAVAREKLVTSTVETFPLVAGPDVAFATPDDFPLTWDQILEPHYYTKCGKTFWMRPGKSCSETLSLSLDPADNGLKITNFSESDSVLKPRQKYQKHELYAVLNPGKPLPKRKKLKVVSALDIGIERTRWFWDGRIAMGTLALLAGRQDIGKSTLAYKLAAEVTNGTLVGEYFGEPRSVIVVATEDSWRATINPRLMASGADLSRVFKVEASDPNEYGLSLPDDIEELAEITRDVGASLILLDPLMSRVDKKLDTHKDSEVRKALEPLVKMAELAGAAVLGLIHVNKGGSTDPLNSIMASAAFTAVARAVLYVVIDSEDEDLRIMGQVKNNLGQRGLPELTYCITPKEVGQDDGPIIGTTLTWKGEVAPGTAAKTLGNRTRHNKIDDAKEWLEQMLQGNSHLENGLLARELKEQGEIKGFNSRMLNRALVEIGGESQTIGFPGVAYWKIPA